jgi:hypothetical protein
METIEQGRPLNCLIQLEWTFIEDDTLKDGSAGVIKRNRIGFYEHLNI